MQKPVTDRNYQRVLGHDSDVIDPCRLWMAEYDAIVRG